MRHIRIFVSSPGDANHERGRVDVVVQGLNREFAGTARLETIRWETEFYRAHETFQAQIPEAAECDIVIAVFRHRIGTELPSAFAHHLPDGSPYPSGTAYEVLSAIEAYRRQGHPDVYVFRTPDPPMVRLDDPEAEQTEEQWLRLKEFWASWFVASDGRFKAAYQPYATIDDFETKIDRLLRGWLEDKVLRKRAVLWPIEVKGSPFRGLAAFGAKHAPVFFGRSRAIARAVDEWQKAAARGTPFLLLVGASGSGKSSLARAGIVPRITARGFVPTVDLWRVAVMRPSETSGGPIMSLAARLFDAEQDIPEEELGRPPALPEIAQGDYRTPAELARLFSEAGLAASAPVTRALEHVAETEHTQQGYERQVRVQLLIVIDQLDELFDPDVTSEQRNIFARLLAVLAETRQVWLLATLRADLYERFLAEPALMALKTNGAAYDLSPPGQAELAEIVREPAKAAALVFEMDPEGGEQLDERLLHEADRPDMLPLLQLALNRLFEDRVAVADGAMLTIAAYETLGGLAGVIDREAERALTGLDEADIGRLPQLLRRLAAISQLDSAAASLGSASLTIRTVPLAEAAPNAASRRLVQALVEARILLTTGEGTATGIRLTHQRVLTDWTRARELVAASTEFFRIREDVEDQRRKWNSAGRDGNLLIPSGLPLAQAESIVTSFGDDLSAATREFVAASSAAEAARQLRERRRKRLLRSWAGAATIFFLLASVGSVYLAYKLDTERRTTSQLLVERAERAVQGKDYFRALELANRAWENWQYLALEYRQRAYGVVREMLAANQRLLRILPQGGRVRAVAFNREGELAVTGSEDNTARLWNFRTGEAVGTPMRHNGPVMAVAFDPNGELLVTGSDDQTARLWNAHTGEPIGKPMQHQGPVRAVAFDPKGECVVTGSLDKTARLWNARGGDPVGRPMQHDDLVIAVAFDPTGERVVTGSEDNTARLWKAKTGDPIGSPMQHGNAVLVAAFDPKGELLVTGSRDKTARLWDARDGRPIGKPMPHDAPVWAAAFDSKGELLVTGSGDNNARLWNARTGKPIGKPMLHDGPVKAVAFDPNGERVATGSLDKTVRLWNAKTGEPIGSPMRHDASVTAVAFDATGERIITGSEDDTARLWDARASEPIEKPMQHDGPVLAVAFDPNGELVATGSEDNTARLWTRRTAEPVGTPMQHHGPVVAIAFDRKGDRVVTGSWDRTARLWDTHTGEPIGQPMQHDAPVVAVVFNQKGDRVVTGSKDKTARLWNAYSGEPVGKPMQHDGPVVAVAFDPTGKRVVTGSEDNTARLWNADTGEPVGNPMHHLDAVVAVAFAPNGERVATGAAWKDRTARLWNASTGEPIGKPMRHQSDLTTVAFDPTGERVVTGSLDNTARLWDARTGEPVGAPMQHDGAVWAVAFDHQGKLLATGSQDKTVRLWSARTGEPVGTPMQHDGEVWAVAFDPRDRLVATGSWDNAARLWLALSAQTLFQRGRTILGAAGEPTTIPVASPDFLTWLGKKIGGAV